MIHFVLVTHLGVGKSLVNLIETLSQDRCPIPYVEIDSDRPIEEGYEKIKNAIANLQPKEGVILLTELFGATPANLCLKFCIEPHIKLISGINVPILLKVATTSFTGSVAETADFLTSYGIKNITYCKCESALK